MLKTDSRCDSSAQCASSAGAPILRVIQWDGSKGMWCTVDGDEVWVPAAQEGASRSVEVTPGSSRVRCGRSGEGFRVEIAEGESLLVSPGTSFPPVEDLLKSGAAQTENTALVRVVKWNDSTWVSQPFQPIDARLPGILVGKECFEKLQLERGAVVTLASPLRGLSDGGLAPFGMVPKGHAFQVAGWFSSGYHEYDSRMAVLSLETAQETLGVGDSVIWLDVRFADPGNLERKTQEIRAALEPYDLGEFVSHAMGLYRELQSLSGEGGLALARGGEEFTSLSQAVILSQIGKTRDLKFGVRQRYKLISWEEMNANLFGALKLQKVVLTVFFLIIIAVAAFNVVGSQVMQIHDKRASIAILKAMGAPQQGYSARLLDSGGSRKCHWNVCRGGTGFGAVLPC